MFWSEQAYVCLVVRPILRLGEASFVWNFIHRLIRDQLEMQGALGFSRWRTTRRVQVNPAKISAF